MAETARFALPLLHPGQAQKEMFHNEAVTRIDALLHPSVKGVANVAPTDAAAGDSWIVGPGAGGDWAGRDDSVVTWTDGGWRFVAPRAGMTVWSESLAQSVRYADGGWQAGVISGVRVEIGGVQVVGTRGDAIAAPSGGVTVDSEARAAIGALLAALRAHGLIASA